VQACIASDSSTWCSTGTSCSQSPCQLCIACCSTHSNNLQHIESARLQQLARSMLPFVMPSVQQCYPSCGTSLRTVIEGEALYAPADCKLQHCIVATAAADSRKMNHTIRHTSVAGNHKCSHAAAVSCVRISPLGQQRVHRSCVPCVCPLQQLHQPSNTKLRLPVAAGAVASSAVETWPCFAAALLLSVVLLLRTKSNSAYAHCSAKSSNCA
jgi:hypothetical protein